MDAEEAGVGVVGVEGHEAVGELVGVQGLRQGRSRVRRAGSRFIPRAEHSLHHHEGHRVRALPRGTLERDAEARGGHVVVADPDVGSREVRGVRRDELLDGRARRAQPAERVGGELDEFVVVHRSGPDEHHARCGVVGADVRR